MITHLTFRHSGQQKAISLQSCSCASGVAGVVETLIDSAGDVNGLLSTMGMPSTLEYLEVCS